MMKRLSFILAIIACSCSSNVTTPPLAEHPFPPTFHKVIVTYKAIPEHWYSNSSSWNSSGQTEAQSDSGTAISSGTLEFDYDSSSCKWKLDTLSAHKTIYQSSYASEDYSLAGVIDRTDGIIETLKMIYSNQGGGPSSQPTTSLSYSFSCQHLSYTSDPAGVVTGVAQGIALKKVLVALSDETSYQSAEHSNIGNSSSSGSSWNGSVNDSASITIRFIP